MKERKAMFVVEVEVIKQWTDRGDNPWVTIRVLGGREDGEELDIEPSRLIQVKRSMILVHDDS